MNVRAQVEGLLRWLVGVPPARGPQGDRPVRYDSGRDSLLSVNSAAAARAALDAAERAVVVDGRATAWLVLAQLGHPGALLALFVMLDRDSVPNAVAFIVYAGMLLLGELCQRASGVVLKPPPGRLLVALLVVGFAAVAAIVAFDLPSAWFVAFMAACVLGAVLTPIARWVRSRRRGSHPGWGAGTQAFAILTMLDRTQAMTPSYLLGRAGLEPEAGASWIQWLRTEHVLMGGEVRRRPLAPAWVEITDTGREQLARMRAELGQAAAEVPVGW